jgi:dCTP deaminase
MILSGQTIRRLRILEPFAERTVLHGLSYGVSAAGYDIRAAQGLILWPGRFVLASSVERFKMPDNVLGRVCDKSTWIRLGLAVHNTVIEPGWEGYLTLELKVVGYRFLRVRPGSPIAQVVFEWLDEPAEQPYRGKYQFQKAGVNLARMEV